MFTNETIPTVTTENAAEYGDYTGPGSVIASSQGAFLNIVNPEQGSAIQGIFADQVEALVATGKVEGRENYVVLSIVPFGIEWDDDGNQIETGAPPSAAAVNIPPAVAAKVAYDILEGLMDRGLDPVALVDEYESVMNGPGEVFEALEQAVKFFEDGVDIDDLPEGTPKAVVALVAMFQNKPTPGCDCEACEELREAQAAGAEGDPEPEPTPEPTPEALAMDGTQVGGTLNILGVRKGA